MCSLIFKGLFVKKIFKFLLNLERLKFLDQFPCVRKCVSVFKKRVQNVRVFFACTFSLNFSILFVDFIGFLIIDFKLIFARALR